MKWKSAIAWTLLATASTVALSATPVAAVDQKEISTALAAEKRELALALATEDKALRQDLIGRLSAGQLAVNLPEWLNAAPASASLKSDAQRADLEVRRRKGLVSAVDNLLQVRLADKSMLTALKKGVEPLYAFEPAGNEADWQFIEAFDRFGGAHALDVHRMPSQPVLVVDIDAKKDLAAGLALMRKTLVGLTGRSAVTTGATTSTTTTPTSKLTAIRLTDDAEPWISGDAEIYALVAGVDPSINQPALDLVDMPYLDNDGATYSPNQVLILWTRYRWAAANVILMEHDDDTNYQDLVANLFTIASQILTLAGQPVIGTLVGLGDGLISAMPSNWFSNDDDYVDSYYTLEKNRYYTNYPGAAGNALVTLQPYSLVSQ